MHALPIFASFSLKLCSSHNPLNARGKGVTVSKPKIRHVGIRTMFTISQCAGSLHSSSFVRMCCITLSAYNLRSNTKLFYKPSVHNRPGHLGLGHSSVYEHPHPLTVQPRRSIEEVMHRLHIALVRLKELELEPPRPEHRSQCHIELCICQIDPDAHPGASREMVQVFLEVRLLQKAFRHEGSRRWEQYGIVV